MVELSAAVRLQYQERNRLFQQRAIALGRREMVNYVWYHTIDLGNGLVTPGAYDYRNSWPLFSFPQDLQGKSVLDIGSATGFFAFEFEKRGAKVTSVELPSLTQLDRFPGQTTDELVLKIQRMHYPRAESSRKTRERIYSAPELYRLLLDGPFTLSHKLLRSRVKRCYSSVYDLTLKKVRAKKAFDIVFLGDVLIHTISPLQALAAIAPVCKGMLIISQVMDVDSSRPSMEYVGGSTLDDEISWWRPNKAMFTDVLRKLGFARVEQAGVNCGYLQHEGFWFERPVIHASRPHSTKLAK